jgi:folate-binding protein YgfZ
MLCRRKTIMTQTARRIVHLGGKDALTFLQGLVSNDVLPLQRGPGLIWTALLTAQGKYLVDFFVGRQEQTLFVDLPEALADDSLRRLSLYRLRADVTLTPCDWAMTRGLGSAPPKAMADPRHPGLGWRLYGAPLTVPSVDWDAIRVAHVIPETGVELIPNQSYLLECGFERLHGVDFRKGCYVGQEVTARMKHKTDLRKGLAPVLIDQTVPAGTALMVEGREAGTIYTQSGGRAIAYLQFDKASDEMHAGPAKVTRLT